MNGGNVRENRTMRRALYALCVLVAVSLAGCGAEFRGGGQLGQHRITIIESRWLHAYGGGPGVQTLPDGKQVFTYRAGKRNIRLEDEVLTVDDKQYVIPNKDDAITLRNGRVKINGQPAQPQPE
jgi:hypothetical protein